MTAKPEKPDFSNVQGGHDAAPAKAPPSPPDFGNVSGGFDGDAEAATGRDAGPETTYTVRSGDTLSRIAHKRYGHSKHWRLIFDANRDQIDNPDLIHPGQVLVMPPSPAA